MRPEFHWLLPTEGDRPGRASADPSVDPSTDQTTRPAHWIDVAQAAEYAGFHGLLLPSGQRRPDAWGVAAALAGHTERLRFIVALRPGFVLPALAAQAVQSLQEISGHRLTLSVLTGGEIAEHHAYGDLVNHDDRFARATEFLQVLAQAWKGRPNAGGFDHHGTHYRVEGGGLQRPLRQPPALYLGGGSPAAERVAAAHADLYYHWAEPEAALQARLARLRAQAAAHGRRLRFGTRLHLIARDTEGEAWDAADRLLQRVAAATGRAAGEVRDYEIAPQLWAGIGLLRSSAADPRVLAQRGTALVGSYAQVARRLEALTAAGIESFLLSGDAALEDALRYGEELLPLVRAQAPASCREVA